MLLGCHWTMCFQQGGQLYWHAWARRNLMNLLADLPSKIDKGDIKRHKK